MTPTPPAAPPPPAPPALGWSDLAGMSVGLWGPGVETAASLRRLRTLGVVPVVVADTPETPTFGGLRVHAIAEGGLAALARCDVVVKAPGVSRYRQDVRALAADGVAICGGLGLWMHDAPRERVCCITGTKGKSTTTALAGHLIAGLGRRCMVAGNIGQPPWDPASGDDWDFWVVETSSYQATDLAVSPPVVAVTSLGPDHLDWHGGSVESYYADKLSACSRPGAQLTVADGSSHTLRAHGALLGPTVQWVDVGDPALDGPWVDVLGLPGRHYRRDALIARACVLALGIDDAAFPDKVARAAAGFTPLDSRYRSLGEVDGVEFIDDSLSTNVLPTLAALEALADRPVALLVGGQDRGIDYGPLARALAVRAAGTLVLTLPANGRRIGEEIRAAVVTAGCRGPDLIDVPNIVLATAEAFQWARPRAGVVLLSPAAPSFGQFRDYKDRSAAFAAAVDRCIGVPQA